MLISESLLHFCKSTILGVTYYQPFLIIFPIFFSCLSSFPCNSMSCSGGSALDVSKVIGQ